MRVRLAASRYLLFVLFASNWAADAQPDDPLSKTFSRDLRPAVESLIVEFRGQRRYKAADFPLPPERFGQFKEEVVSEFIRALHLEDWVV